MARPVNPYVAGAALRGEEGFCGRQDTLTWVERELRNPATGALVLFGQRRIGKTSILMQLQRTLPPDLFLPVYFDLQDQAARPLAQVLADLADTAAERLALEPPDPDEFDDRGRFFSRTFLPQLYRFLGSSRRPIFLLDEFDVLDRVVEAGLAETTAARSLFSFVRRVMSEDPRPAFVFVVGRRAEELSLDFTATFKTSLVREVWVLDRGSARTLVRQAEANGSLRFTDEAVARMLDLTSCHPYFTQLLCQRVWERAHAGRPAAAPLVDAPLVENGVADALEVGGQAFVWLWGGLSPAEKVYAAAVAGIAGEAEAVPGERVIEVLASQAARLRTREVELAPRDLVKRRVFESADGQGHRFTVEMFRRWVRENRPLRQVKDELDRVEPVAERMYGVGLDLFKQRDWEAAARYFRDALGVYPNHFHARLYLGEALLELGQVEEAVAQLERAHELDRDEAKYALARARALASAPGEIPALLVDDARGAIYLGDREVQLSRLEHLVLSCLAERVGQVVSKDTVADSLRADGRHADASVDAAIYRLRKKLGDSGHNPTYLETRRGQGYVLRHATYVPIKEGGS